MADLFLKFVNTGISASWIVLAIVILRFLLKKAPKWLRPVLWGIVGVRLILPFSIESVFSLVPSAETISPEIMYTPEPTIHSGISALNTLVNPVITESFAPKTGDSVNPLQVWIPAAAAVWIFGVGAMLVYAFISYLRLSRRMKTAVLLRDNIYQSENVVSPFVLGILRPRIYLPFGMEENTIAHVTAHEQAHIVRRDHQSKPFGFLLLSLYWFHPVLWAAYFLFCRDIELACDERTVRALDAKQRADYSDALLSCSVSRKGIAFCPLAFGEVGVKERVKNVLNYKKPAFWVVSAAVAACIVMAVCFLTNPKSNSLDRPVIIMDDIAYIDPFMPLSQLPYGYEYAGTLDAKQAKDTGLSGCEYYANPFDESAFYVYQECGTPIDINTVDSQKKQWAYKRWIRLDSNIMKNRRLTLDDVVRLSKKGDDLKLEDFDRYAYYEIDVACGIRIYEIDEMFSLWMIGGKLWHEPEALDIYLRANDALDELFDLRSGDAEAFIDEHKNSSVVKEDTFFPYPENRVANVAMVGNYWYKGSNFAIYDDGSFGFCFSTYSSYLGFGKYEVADNRLILRTDDGRYTYVFDIAGNTMVFDAAASSKALWGSQMVDGAVFE